MNLTFIYDELPENPSWKFIDATYNFANPMNPFASTFPTTYSINGLSGTEIADFVGIKMGDLNSSAIPNQLVSADTRTDLEDLVLKVEDQKMKIGEEYTIEFKAKDFHNILGYQFTLDLDESLVEFVDVKMEKSLNLTMDNFGFNKLNKGVITSSWNNRIETTLSDDTVIFSLLVKAKSTTPLSEALTISTQYVKAEAYTSEMEMMDIDLEFELDKGGVKDVFDLYQNTPNPFRSETTIGFYLPESSEAKFRIYDLTGRTLLELDGNYQAGYNEVVISTVDLKGANVMYYKLSLSDRSKVKRMVVIKE